MISYKPHQPEDAIKMAKDHFKANVLIIPGGGGGGGGALLLYSLWTSA